MNMFCFSHIEPHLPVQLYDAVVFTKPQPDYETLVGAVALPVLARLAPPSGTIGICTYRKIVARGTPAQLSADGPYEKCDPNLPRSEIEPHPGYEFLVHKCRFMGNLNVVEHFGACHGGYVDWIDYMRLTEELHILTPIERNELEQDRVLLEGGIILGVFPADVVWRACVVAHRLNSEFAARYGARIRSYDPLSRRIIASLSERLESYWIMRDLRGRYPNGIPEQIFGRLLTTAEGRYERGRFGE